MREDKIYTVVWNDFEYGIELFHFYRENLAVDFAIEACATTYEEIPDFEDDCFYASIKDRFEMFINAGVVERKI